MDLEEEQHSCQELLTRMHTAEHTNPEISEGLSRIRAEKQRHREEIRTMLMRSEPYAHPDLTIGHPDHDLRVIDTLLGNLLPYLMS